MLTYDHFAGSWLKIEHKAPQKLKDPLHKLPSFGAQRKFCHAALQTLDNFPPDWRIFHQPSYSEDLQQRTHNLSSFWVHFPHTWTSFEEIYSMCSCSSVECSGSSLATPRNCPTSPKNKTRRFSNHLETQKQNQKILEPLGKKTPKINLSIWRK